MTASGVDRGARWAVKLAVHQAMTTDVTDTIDDATYYPTYNAVNRAVEDATFWAADDVAHDLSLPLLRSSR